MPIEIQKKLIDWWEELIGQVQKQISIWLDELSCWMRVIVFYFRFLVIAILGGLTMLFYLTEPILASSLSTLIIAVVGIYFLSRRTQAAEQSLNVERFTRAIDHLTSKDLFVRLGGILGLEQIANIHEEEREKIARVLVSFIRTQAVNSKRSKKDFKKIRVSKLEDKEEFSAYRAQRLDIEAAVNALARIALELEKEGHFQEQHDRKKHNLCDLRDTDLRGLQFVGTDLSNFNFSATDLSGAWLKGARFAGAQFYKIKSTGEVSGAKFIRAHLNDTDFSGAYLNYANFSHIDTTSTKFIKTYLNRAIFIGVQMFETEFDEANLIDANFTGAVLVEAEMDEAILKNVNFTDAHLEHTYGLRQPQLKQSFRWKGHNTFVYSSDGQSLEPPPEKEKPAEFESCISSENTHRWEIYKDSIGAWRWMRSYPDGQIDCSSNEGYKDKVDCITNARRHGMDCDLSQ